MTILLTGGRGAGKSTLVRRTVDALNVHPGGFVTRFDHPAAPDKTLFLGDGADMRAVARVRGGWVERVHAEVFDGYGVQLVGRSAPLVVMDELGRLETEARRFRAAVVRRMLGDTPVLAALGIRDGGWPSELLRLPGALFFEVTEANRDALLEQIVARLSREVGA